MSTRMPEPQARAEALRRARALREQFRAGGEFEQSHFVAALAERLKGLEAAAFAAFVKSVGKTVDDESAGHDRRPDPAQRELFDLEGEYRLGESRRIAKRIARIDHADAAFALDLANLQAVLGANHRKLAELNALRPHWRSGRTKEQAVAAWRDEHPDREGS